MGWFEEQLHIREESDRAILADALDSLAGAVMGERLRNALSQKEIAASAIDWILKYYHRPTKSEPLPDSVHTVAEQVEYRMRPFGIKSRTVTLEKGWYRHGVGAFLGTLKEDGSAVALLPGKLRGYWLVDIRTGRQYRLNRKTELLLDKEALCFYESLPQRSLCVRDLLHFMMKQLDLSDVVLYLILMGLSTALGLLSPMFTKWLFSDVLLSGSLQLLLSLAVFVICFSVSQLCILAFQTLVRADIGIKQKIAVQAAVMSRLLSLPPSFFRQFSAGELAQRATYVQTVCGTLLETIVGAGLPSLFSLIYIGQVFAFTPSLGVPALAITAATVLLTLATALAQIEIRREQMRVSAKTNGLSYATITGIQKIKLAGAETRMFSRWARQYSKQAQLEYNPPLFLKINSTLHLTLGLLGTIVLYAVAVKSQVSVADYYAFSSAYGMVSAAFMGCVSVAVNLAGIRPALEMAKPILETEPESQDKKELVTELGGSIELSHVSFRYDESLPNVIDDLSLKIRPGEYLAVVGPTGCGKSTLMRLLLGFETPQKGSIFFDRKDISRLDLESFRSRIGTVMQDGKLFSGDLYSNIVLSAPWLTMDEAWEAAEIAAIADDIRQMPMGMHTVISEGQGGISGGQKQRLMIARAVAPKPKILIFDEATCALDNITQKKISDTFDTLSCTRIMIAHRLSTIRHADRIIYLKDGRIEEDGTYEELIAKNGLFAELVERQRLDIEG